MVRKAGKENILKSVWNILQCILSSFSIQTPFSSFYKFCLVWRIFMNFPWMHCLYSPVLSVTFHPSSPIILVRHISHLSSLSIPSHRQICLSSSVLWQVERAFKYLKRQRMFQNTHFGPLIVSLNWFISLWQWHINVTVTVLDIIHRPVYYFKAWSFGNWILCPCSGGTFSFETNR
jgi:hypothetical protein